MAYPLLEQIGSAQDLKRLETAQLEPLCAELRGFDRACPKQGGHLSSNLGSSG